MAVDAAMRKLKIPPRFMPYMEKHRIYELFYDLGNQLAIFQPDDHIVFLKESLEKVNQGSRDRRIIVFMAPPYFDRVKLAQLLSVKTDCEILTRYLICLKPGNYYDPDALATNTANYIRHSRKEGWILADFPDTVEEAKLLINAGILPTHAFLLLTDEGDQNLGQNGNLRTVETTQSIQLGFENSAYKLQELFKASLKILKLNPTTTLLDIAKSCAQLMNKMPQVNAPKLYRLVVIGPRGSRRRTLAKLLNKLYNLVHVDMLELINSARCMENNIGDAIRYMDTNEYAYSKPLVFDLLKTRLYQTDCLERGYVLTNFPWCLEDLVVLDSLETPPNKVVFFDINGVCQERLNDRVVNMYTGTLYSEKIINKDDLLNEQSMHHPDDEECKVSEEIQFYKQNVKAMIEYCGNTCNIINAEGPIKSLLERVENVLMSPSPIGKPRSWKIPYNSSIQPKLNEPLDQNLNFRVSRTDVIPLIESSDLLDRFQCLKLKRNPDDDDFRSNITQDISIDTITKQSYSNENFLYESEEDPEFIKESE